MRKIIRFCLVIVVALLGASGVSLFFAYRASQHVPEFYERALRAEPKVQAKAGDELVKQVCDLQNEVNQDGRWQAIFTDEQINGWLAAELPKFPKALPKEIHDPRVAIEPEEAQIACRYESGSASAVVSIALDIRLTDEPNVLAVRVRNARAGLIPLPLKQGIDRISAAALEAGIPLRWAQQDGDPVALVTVPANHKQYARKRVTLETVELRSGKIVLAGHSESAASAADTAQAGGN